MVRQYEKLEITFKVETTARNLQLPFSATPPQGIEPRIGISVDALFTNDNWRTSYSQPAFYYQDFIDQKRPDYEWIYPTDQFAWKVRFSPNRPGEWQFKLIALDSNGRRETAAQRFNVAPSSQPGFIRVSASDPRYFEFENGTFFPALGYNLSTDHLDFHQPTKTNPAKLQAMADNGIRLARIWLSGTSIYSSAWNPWNAMGSAYGWDGYIPYTSLTMETAYPGSDVAMRLESSNNPCMYYGFNGPPAVKTQTSYRIRVRYRTNGLEGPRITGKPYGLVAKTGGWLWGDGNNCNDPGSGQVVTFYQAESTTEWGILEGKLQTGNSDFLPYFYLVLENVRKGDAYIDYVWIEEELDGGKYGPNILSKPWMAHHLYMDQFGSYAFDQILELAEQKGLYFKLVVMEKNEYILNRIDYDGLPILDSPLCAQTSTTNQVARCPGNQWFYGDWQRSTKVRWLQEAWWRYLQARWGYSTHIHSWELLNEGDPFNGRHYSLADEFAKYMHQFKPNDHLVTTSFWHSFPGNEFWNNPQFPHLDFADLHLYVKEGSPYFEDTALFSYDPSMQFGALQSAGAKMPLVRGETGFLDASGNRASEQLIQDKDAIWLHKLVWGQINPGGMVDSYWFDTPHLFKRNDDGSYAYDHRNQYRPYYEFIHTIPLNNGNYTDAKAVVSNETLRVWGQKDTTQGQAHLWIQNKAHIWQAVVAGKTIPSVSGTVSLSDFQPETRYQVEWWDTYPRADNQQILIRETLVATADGSLTLVVEGLKTDIAVKIYK